MRSAQGPWSVCGIPLQVDASWFFIVAFVTWSLSTDYFPARYGGLSHPVYWAMGGIAALSLFGCVLLHELGHSLVAKRYGIPVSHVTLFIFGGVAHIGSDPKRPLVELQMALAGPLVSALIAGACFLAAGTIRLVGPMHLVAAAILRYLAFVNVAILLFNLLPGFPLDGGRVLRAALWAWSGSLFTATRVASAVGSMLGWGLLILGLWEIHQGVWVGGVWSMCLGFFLRNAARASYRQASSRLLRQ